MSSRSPSNPPPMFPRQMNHDSASNVLLNPTDTNVRNAIWGPWYWFAKCTFQFFSVPPEAPKFVKFLSNLPNLITLGVFIVRSVFLLYVMMRSKALSIFWSYATIVFFLSLHNMVSAIILLVYKVNPFVPKVIMFLRKASFNRISRVPGKSLLKCTVTVLTFTVPAAIYIIECFIRYSKHEEKFNSYYAGNSTQLNSIYGDKRFMYFIDAIVVLWGAFVSSSVMILYLLANNSLCREYAIFNKELTAHINDGSIIDLSIIKSFQSQLIDYLRLACYLNNISNAIVNLTFMAGIMTQIAAQFALYSFSTHMSTAQNVLYGFWVAQSFLLLVYSLRKPAILHNMACSFLMTETKHHIWLDQGIWSKCSNPEVHTVARNIVDRIATVDYASKGMTSTRAGNYLFNAVLIVIPFFVDILGGYKYIDSTVPAH